MVLKRWGKSASGVEMGKKEQLLPPLKQWERNGEQQGPGGGRDAGSAEPGPGRAGGAAGGGGAGGAERPAGDAPCPGRCSQAVPGLSRPSPPPSGPFRPLSRRGVPGRPGVSAAAGPSRRWHRLCPFPAGSAAPLPALRGERCPGPARERSKDGTHAEQAPRGAEPPPPPREGGLGGGGAGKHRARRRRLPETAAPAPLGSGPSPRAGP